MTSVYSANAALGNSLASNWAAPRTPPNGFLISWARPRMIARLVSWACCALSSLLIFSKRSTAVSSTTNLNGPSPSRTGVMMISTRTSCPETNIRETPRLACGVLLASACFKLSSHSAERNTRFPACCPIQRASDVSSKACPAALSATICRFASSATIPVLILSSSPRICLILASRLGRISPVQVVNADAGVFARSPSPLKF